jgi:hypothetical protein
MTQVQIDVPEALWTGRYPVDLSVAGKGLLARLGTCVTFEKHVKVKVKIRYIVELLLGK